MTNYIITTDQISTTGNGIVLANAYDTLFVGRNATLGSTFLSGRGVVMQGVGQQVRVAGAVVGLLGVELLGPSGEISVFSGGVISSAGTALALTGFGVVTNAGTISGSRGIYAGGSASVTNSGSLSGGSDAIFIIGDGVLDNLGTISGTGTAVFINGAAAIRNFGSIVGGVASQAGDDTVINRGLITGNVASGAGVDLVDTDSGRIEGVVFLGAGDDTFIGGAFSDKVRADQGRDDLSGASGDDYFIAVNADGNDRIDGGAGADTYDARLLTTTLVLNLTIGVARNLDATDSLTGIENAFGGAGADRMSGNVLNNILTGAGGADLLSGAAGADRLNGGIGADTLYGGDGADALHGGEGRDVLLGGTGDDVLWGSYDVDIMSGNSGADRFDFNDFDEFLVVSGLGHDLITDFTRGQDLIDLSTIDANGTLAGNQAFKFEGTAAVNAYGDLGYRFAGGYTVISIGFNTPTAYDVLVLTGNIALTAADFLL
ncbi:MAG: M10 family metallopeptidase C-terminal domain-containing protein [Paracoccaceae bacterium]